MVAEDPRAKKSGICGVTTVGGSGIEWICVNPVHGETYMRKSSDRHHRKGELIFSNNPKADQHFMVRRWPNRNGVSEEVDAQAGASAHR